MRDDGGTGQDLVDTLLRWQQSGGVWRVLARHPTTVTVALLRCDAGEEVDRISSGDAAWMAFLADRDSGAD
ncbi:hypothetical protein KRR39_02405 [Nocardioides panacis]|uniref:Uncharacterized protein n=1 Tax=Nocardioides panacis TaxID=2849501 RepID=A0A975T2V2_9ACTN|nr:hypothetical protein KRR39_02405 [Nocardioides panacis]